MNYIKHLTGFFEKVIQDKTLNPTHISLYIALFQCWNCNRFKNPISISRDEVMRISKISSKATYHKCLKNLHSLGYINYEPSFNPFRGSHVYLFNFSDDLKPQTKSERKPKNEPLLKPVSEQALNKSYTSSETSTEQAVVPSINNTNILKNENVSNLNQQTKNFEEINNFQLKNQNSEMQSAFADTNKKQTEDGQQKEKSSAKKEKESCHTEEACTEHSRSIEVSHNQKSNPDIEEIKTYFQENNFPELEAQKFFNYFSSVGWLVGGKTPMVDWQAAAQNWMLNSSNFNQNNEKATSNRAKHLNTPTDKNYAEPL